MQFTVERSAFAEAVAWTARVLPARPAVPVLAGLRMEAGGGQLRLSGFDYEVSARSQVPITAAGPGSGTGAAVVSGRLLAEIARMLPDAPVQVAADGARVRLTCGHAHFTLLTLPLEDYPRLPDMPARVGTAPAADLAAAIRQVVPAAGRDDTLPMLTGVHVVFGGEELTLAATDRYRIALRRLDWHADHPDPAASALVPARTLHDIARSLPAAGEAAIALSTLPLGAGAAAVRSEGMIGFDAGGRRTTSRLIDSDFAEVESRFPDAFEETADVAAAPLVEAVKRVALVADRTSPVRLSFRPGEVVLEAGSGEDAQAAEALAADYSGAPIRIAFAPGYLLDGLAAVRTEAVRIRMAAPTRPVVIAETGGAEFRYLVMPLRSV